MGDFRSDPDLMAALARAAEEMPSLAAHVLLTVLRDGDASRGTVTAALAEAGLHDEEVSKIALADVFLWCVRQAIQDEELTDSELTSLRTLRLLCSIDEGDLLATRRHVVQQIVQEAMESILLDDVVTKEEAAYKVDLQELLGLGYDDFLRLSEGAVVAALESIAGGRASKDRGFSDIEWGAVLRKSMLLDTVIGLKSGTLAPVIRASGHQRQ